MDEEMRDAARQLARRCGFSTLSGMLSSLLDLVMRAPLTRGDMGSNDVADMFADYEDWQRDNGNRHDMNQRR